MFLRIGLGSITTCPLFRFSLIYLSKLTIDNGLNVYVLAICSLHDECGGASMPPTIQINVICQLQTLTTKGTLCLFLKDIWFCSISKRQLWWDQVRWVWSCKKKITDFHFIVCLISPTMFCWKPHQNWTYGSRDITISVMIKTIKYKGN